MTSCARGARQAKSFFINFPDTYTLGAKCSLGRLRLLWPPLSSVKLKKGIFLVQSDLNVYYFTAQRELQLCQAAFIATVMAVLRFHGAEMSHKAKLCQELQPEEFDSGNRAIQREIKSPNPQVTKHCKHS